MTLNSKFNYIYIFIFTIFFFFWTNYSWDILWSLIDVKKFYFLFNFQEGYIKLRPSYLVILLLVPIFLHHSYKNLSLNYLFFNNQKKIFLFIIFIITHYFLSKLFYDEIVVRSELLNICYLLFLSIIYCHYRDFIILNFNKILYLYLIIFVLFSFSINHKEYNFGQCQSDFFLIALFKEYFNLTFTNSIYSENSHLGMMMVGVLFSSLFALKEEINNKHIFIFFIILSIIVLFNNLSTTYFISYFVSQIFLILFFYKKVNKNFWITTISLLILNSIFFLTDKNCTTKITDFNFDDVKEQRLNKTSDDIRNNKNTTTLIYERSIIIAFETIKSRPFGWGIDGLDNATYDLITRPQYNDAYILVKQLNIKDGLSNLLKIITEFGILSIFIIYLFFNYIFKLKNFSSYNIFVIILFLTMCIRGAGYFNGGFIFCLFEFLFYETKKIKKN